MNLSDAAFEDALKLYFGTLFSRTMPNLIFGLPDHADNEVLFTNISLSEAEFYYPDPNYYIHLVRFKDRDFVEDLFGRFPLFQQGIVLIRLDEFLPALSKHTGSLDQLKLHHTHNQIVLETHESGETSTMTACGEIISAYQVSKYMDIFDSVKADTECATESLEGRINKNDKMTFLHMELKSFGDDAELCCVALNNQATVSERYLRSVKDDYEHTVLLNRNGKTIQAIYLFNSPSISIKSVQPAVVWFPKRKDKQSQ